MTVAELVKALQEMPPHWQVLIDHDDPESLQPLRAIKPIAVFERSHGDFYLDGVCDDNAILISSYEE